MPVAALKVPPRVPRSVSVYICAKQVLAAKSSKEHTIKSVGILFIGKSFQLDIMKFRARVRERPGGRVLEVIISGEERSETRIKQVYDWSPAFSLFSAAWIQAHPTAQTRLPAGLHTQKRDILEEMPHNFPLPPLAHQQHGLFVVQRS